jgi:hypothetical protein
MIHPQSTKGKKKWNKKKNSLTPKREKKPNLLTPKTKTISIDVYVGVCMCVQGSCKGIENGNRIFYRFAWKTPPETDSSNVK